MWTKACRTAPQLHFNLPPAKGTTSPRLATWRLLYLGHHRIHLAVFRDAGSLTIWAEKDSTKRTWIEPERTALFWLPLFVFVLDEWLKAMWRVWQLPRDEAAEAFMWWA